MNNKINSLTIQLVSCNSANIKLKEPHNNTNELVATIHHLEVSIYDPTTIDYLGKTKCLVDTGCSMTSISSTFFNQINSKGTLTVDKPNTNITTTTCDGSENEIAGITTIMIGFNAKRQSRSFGININVLIIPNLQSKMILGLDFLASQYIDKMTPNKIYYNYKGQIISENFDKTTFAINKHSDSATVAPNNYIEVTIPLELESASYKFTPTINLLQIHSTTFNENSATFKLKNSSPYNIEFPLEKPIVAINQIKNTIKYDEYMDDSELLQAESLMLDTGNFQPSLTSFIESKPTITEFELINDNNNLTDEELLREFELDHLPPKEKAQMINIILSCRPAFSLHKYDIGKTNVLEMDIELINDQHPKIQKYHPIPLHAREKVKDILDQMERHGIIRVCHEPSQYVSNIMVIPKKDKDSIRLLFDGRLLNYDTKRLPMAFVSKPEILGHLMDRNHLSSLDFSDAFFHIPLTKQAQPLTAFYAETNNKRMCFTRAPQGLKNSPLYLKILLDKIFQDLSDNLLFYVDDLLIATKGTLEEHFNLVELVLHRLMKSGLKLRPQKLLLARQRIQFLGMIFERDKLSIPEARIKAFKELPYPTTAKKLKSAICAFSYYRNFIPDFSENSRELMELANVHPTQFKFTEHHETLFRNLIKHICNNTSTYFPVPNKPFYIQTDASVYCAGGRLYQLDDNKDEKLIAAVSRTFTKTERNYSIYKKEALALLYTLRSMEFFIRYAPKLIILVDAKALIYIRLAKESTGILLRFSLELSKYEADIVHVPGKDNEISDLLSRSHKDIESIQADIAHNITINEKDSIRIVKALTLPDNFTLTRDQLINLLDGPSPRCEVSSKVKSKGSKAKEGIKLVKNTPATLSNRRTKMPRLTCARRPGVILPIRVLRNNKNKANNTDRQNITDKTNNNIRQNVSCSDTIDNTKGTRVNQQQITNSYNLRNRKVSFNPFSPKTRSRPNRIKDKHNSRPSGTQVARDDGINGCGDKNQSLISKQIPNNDVRENTRTAEGDCPCGGTLLGQLYDQGQDNPIDRLYPPRRTAPAHETISESMEAFTNLGHSKKNECPGSAKKVMGEKKLLVPLPEPLKGESNCLTRWPNPARLDLSVSQGNGGSAHAGASSPRQDQINPDIDLGSIVNQVDALGQELTTDGRGSTQPGDQGVHTLDQTEFRHHLPLAYEDIRIDSLLSKQGYIDREIFLKLQLNDESILARITQNDRKLNFQSDQGIYFYNLQGNKPYLPKSLARILINSHHYTQPGLHKSRSQITRDINGVYYIDSKTLNDLIKLDTGSCHVCQLFDTASQTERSGSLPRPDKPRLSWSIDLVTDLPKSVNNFKILLLAVDDFSNYLVAVPLKDTSSKELITAIKNNIFAPFGCPKSLRSDEQPSIYNSNEFYEFLTKYSVELTATAIASPFSNGRIERHIKTFKHSARKYFHQNNCINNWDEHLDVIVSSLNSSINTFNHSPEEIMFGQRIPNKLDLIDLNNETNKTNKIDHSNKINELIDRANTLRTNYDKHKKTKEASNTTFKNKKAINKQFIIGDLVLHRQLQVSTGTSSKWKPLFTGPFVIEDTHKDKTFSCKNLLTNKVIRAHSTNLTHYKIDRSTVKLTNTKLSNPIIR